MREVKATLRSKIVEQVIAAECTAP
jgi:hypothetical protein